MKSEQKLKNKKKHTKENKQRFIYVDSLKHYAMNTLPAILKKKEGTRKQTVISGMRK